MIRQVKAELLKVRSTRTTIGLLLGMIVLILLFTLLTGLLATASSFAGTENQRQFFSLSDLAGVFSALAGVMLVASEYRYGTMRRTFLFTPHRSQVLAAKTLAGALAGFAFGVVGAAMAGRWLRDPHRARHHDRTEQRRHLPAGPAGSPASPLGSDRHRTRRHRRNQVGAVITLLAGLRRQPPPVRAAPLGRTIHAELRRRHTGRPDHRAPAFANGRRHRPSRLDYSSPPPASRSPRNATSADAPALPEHALALERVDGATPPAPGAWQQAEVHGRSARVEAGAHARQPLPRTIELAPEDRVHDELAVACREEVELPLLRPRRRAGSATKRPPASSSPVGSMRASGKARHKRCAAPRAPPCRRRAASAGRSGAGRARRSHGTQPNHDPTTRRAGAPRARPRRSASSQVGHARKRARGARSSRRGIRPAPRAAKPAATAPAIAVAIATGSSAREIALALRTAEQPSSIASAASDAVPTPASSTTGTLACSQIRAML